ncbi:MAG: 30S ribosomal protein S3 [Dehalococcoidia bacterium]|nr:30S ribosomal protein S3 [Dehalococcoidia bacterium]
MGQKTHPLGFRLGITKGWLSRWYAEKEYGNLVQEDLRLRKLIGDRLSDASLARVEIDRSSSQLTIAVYTAKPGIVIGKGGQRVDELRAQLERMTGKKVRLNIQEIRQPELEAMLVAKGIAEQIERRVAYKRAIKQAVTRGMQRGAKGIKVLASGRLGGAEMSRRELERAGQVPLHTLRADIDYGFSEAKTTFGRIGIKVWIYKGDVLPEHKRIRPAEVEEVPV